MLKYLTAHGNSAALVIDKPIFALAAPQERGGAI